MEPMTLEGRACMVREAYRKKVEATLPPGATMDTWGIDVLEDAILVRDGEGKLYRVPYTLATDAAEVTFGAQQAVEVQLVPVSEAEVELTEPTGSRWAVRIIREGFSKRVRPIPGVAGTQGRWFYTDDAIESVPAAFEGAPVYAFEFAANRFSHLWGLTPDEKVKRGLVTNLIGYMEHVKTAGQEAVAEMALLSDQATEAVRDKIADLFRRGRQDLVGLSIDARVRGVPVQTKEGMVFAVVAFEKPATVDVATDPAAGGAILRALEALPEKEVAMVQELLQKLRARRPDLAAKLGENPTEAEVKEALLTALDAPGPQAGQGAAGSGQQAASQEALATELNESRKLRCTLLLDKRLGDAKLPAPVEAKLRKRYDGRVFEAAALEAEILEEKTTLDALGQAGLVTGLGAPRAEVGLEQRDKVQLGMDRMWGAVGREAAAPPQDVPAFKGFQHAFHVITGRDLREMFTHVISSAQEDILAATWVNVLGTSMYKRLIKDYREAFFGEDAISRPRQGGLRDFKNVDALRVQYFADLADVDPEIADYAEIAAPGDEIVQYHAIQKGNLVSISRKALLADDLGATTKIVGRLGVAARRTKAKFVWNFATTNANYDVDGLPWFSVANGNLGATALSADLAGANLILTALIALANMTEPGSGERLGLPALRDLRVWLAVPNDLLGVAHALNASDTLPNAANVQCPNPIYHLFGATDERVIVCPLFTDTTDWYVFRDPGEVDSIEIGYLNDQQEPEFFVASVPTVGQMFVADKQQWKVRHEYGADILDFRGAYKSVNP